MYNIHGFQLYLAEGRGKLHLFHLPRGGILFFIYFYSKMKQDYYFKIEKMLNEPYWLLTVTLLLHLLGR